MSKPARKMKTTEPVTLTPGVVAELPLDLIDFDPDQPRQDVDDTYITALAADIAQSGVKQPITVRPHPEHEGRYLIKYGECRTRASRAAKRATIPALLDTDADNADTLARLLDQVKENHLRKDLNPMEWAGVLRRMRDQHKIRAIAEVEATLKRHGITNMGRSYISNIMRLAELPDWAQTLIRTGRLTAAHGKHLLPAAASEKVIEELRQDLVDEGNEYSVRDLQRAIMNLFWSHHIGLDATWITAFDYKTECVATGCQSMRKISTEDDSNTFCLNRECHTAKQKAAKAAAASLKLQCQQLTGDGGGPHTNPNAPAPIVGADNTVNLDEQSGLDYIELDAPIFDVTACTACPHYHIAAWTEYAGDEPTPASVPACFEPSGNCYEQKVAATNKERGRWAELEDHIERWLRRALTERLADDLHTQLAILGTIALWGEQMEWGLDDALDEAAETAGIHGIADLLANGLPTYATYLYGPALTHMPLDYLLPIAQHAGLGVSDYRIDTEYLEDLDRAGLDALIADNAWRLGDDEAAIKATAALLKDDELRTLLAQRTDQLGVPEAIQQAWARLQEGKA